MGSSTGLVVLTQPNWSLMWFLSNWGVMVNSIIVWVGKNSNKVALPSADRKGMWGKCSEVKKRIPYPQSCCGPQMSCGQRFSRMTQEVPAIGDLDEGSTWLNTPNAKYHFSTHWLKNWHRPEWVLGVPRREQTKEVTTAVVAFSSRFWCG